MSIQVRDSALQILRRKCKRLYKGGRVEAEVYACAGRPSEFECC